jgi:hypothetical protein
MSAAATTTTEAEISAAGAPELDRGAARFEARRPRVSQQELTRCVAELEARIDRQGETIQQHAERLAAAEWMLEAIGVVLGRALAEVKAGRGGT